MFDVVIPTKNRPDDIERLLDSILIQSILPNKIIIVDQTTKKIKINKKYNEQLNICHLHNTEISGLCNAKNFGIDNCSSEIIFFFDDDIILKQDFFKKIIDYFHNNKDFYGICGRQINSKSSMFKLLFFSMFHRGPFKDNRKKYNSGLAKHKIVETNILPGGITAYRASIFKKYKFDETLIKYCLGEDMDFSYRVSQNYKLAFAIDADAIHNHSKIDRYDITEEYACKVAGYEYFFRKNLKKNLKNKFYYKLVKIGIFFDATWNALTKFKFDSIKGIIKGKKYVKENFKNVPFIDYKKYTEEKK